MNTLQDRIRGSLIGGAIGDALGYPVEFIKSFKGIQEHYGERGITRLTKPWSINGEKYDKAHKNCTLVYYLCTRITMREVKNGLLLLLIEMIRFSKKLSNTCWTEK